ncbi:MAG: alpha/beta hydrolase [Clostridia bacterium]|nr:alpha/beta hydrolase [Clostridia bacterium]
MKKEFTIGAKIVRTMYYIIIYIFAIFMLGNIFYKIPIYGDVATSYSGSLIHVWIIVATLLLIISLIRFIKIKNKINIINLIISIFSVLVCFFILTKIMISFNEQGVNVSLLKSYFKEDVSKVQKEVTNYVDGEGNELPINLYYSESKNNKPIIVYTHGGGWITGSENDNEYTSKVLAKNGYVVASIGYQLSTEEKHLWDKTEKQILYGINKIATELNSEEIYTIGDSAGGNLALEISYKINNGMYDEVYEEKLPRVKAVSVNYPVTNPKDFYYNNTNVMSSELSKTMARCYTGGSPQEYPNRYETISPANYISKNTPPTSIIVGENDPLVPPYSTYNFADGLNKNGVKSKLVKVPYFGHAGDMYKNNLFNQAYINLTQKWFNDNKMMQIAQ